MKNRRTADISCCVNKLLGLDTSSIPDGLDSSLFGCLIMALNVFDSIYFLFATGHGFVWVLL